MKHKLRSFIACLLCLFQCVMLFSSDVLAATSEGGDISSSFRLDKNEFIIKVVDVYNVGRDSTEVVREEKTYALGAPYSYDAIVPDGYLLEEDICQSNVSGVATSDEEIYFYYEKITDACITFSFDEALCNYLNKYGANVSPTDIVWKIGNYSDCDSSSDIILGEESYFSFSCQDIEKTHTHSSDDIYDEDGFVISDRYNDCLIRSVNSYRTYYYEYGKGWNPQPHYLGSSVDGLAEDEYISKLEDEDNGYMCNFPEDFGVDTDTMSCCHIVLCMEDIDRSGYKEIMGGIYRTVIDDMDKEDNIESWYDYYYDDDGNCIRRPYSRIKDSWKWENEPEKFIYIENGTRIREWAEGTRIYRVRDKNTKEEVLCFADGSEYVFDSAPFIEGYKCINPDAPRKFRCFLDSGGEIVFPCFYYDYIPIVTHKIVVKDKFVDEEGVEERTDTRKEDKIPEDEEYTYKALDPIPDGYKLISDPTVTDTSKEDKEIVFVYQKLHQYTITVKDVFTNEAGVEENTAIRQEDKLYEDSSYHYSALSPVPEGYECIGVTDYAGKASKDMEIVFTYRKKIVVSNTFNVVVKDKYIDTDGSVIKIDERVNTVLNLNDEYNFTALNPEGYEVVGASGYAGRVTENMDITFVYQKKPVEKPATYTFKVVDEYYDADGNIIKTVERTTNTLKEGSSYVCTALKPVPDGYVLISDEEYRGIISEDTTIVFKYKNASIRLVTVKGYLTYKNGEPAANKKVEIHSTVRSAITDADGYYEIRNIETGSHKYTVFNDDGTELITCDLNFTKSGQDTAAVTYKMKDIDVNIDLSAVDVLEIDAVLPLYKLEVYDKYYDEDGQLVKSELRESLTAVKAGTAYSYDALSPMGYSLTSEKNYSGVVTSDTTVIFTYKKNKKPDDKPTPKPTPDTDKPTPDPSPEKKSYKVTVIDNFYDVNAMLISSSVRLTEIKTEGDAYYYEAKPVPNFTLIGADHYSSYINSDLTLAFAYKAVAQPKDAIITVIDRFVDEDGSTEDKIRLTDDKKVGDPYHYEAVSVEGYDIVGSSSYTGIVMSHLTLIFTYQKTGEEPAKQKEYTVTVVDKFITDIPVNEFIIDKSEQTGISDGLNNFNTYHYAREDGKYIYMIRRELRCKDVYMEGFSYQYDAREFKSFDCISETELSGVVNGDIELEFVYARSGLTVGDIPYKVYNSKPDFPDVPEAKTGDLDEGNVIPYVMAVILCIGVIVAALIGRRRRYR